MNIDRKYIYKEETASTNSDLKELIKSSPCPEYTVIRAKKQSGGRGRLGRSFHSPAGGLYFSAAFPLTGEEKLVPALTLLTGLFVCETVEELCEAAPSVKWPNDIFLNGRKLCGILCELTGGKYPTVIAGIGINLSTAEKDIPRELTDIMTSLSIENAALPDPEVFMRTVIGKLDRAVYDEKTLCSDVIPEKYIEKLRARSYLTGKEVKYRTAEKELRGVFSDISDAGEAVIDTGKEEIRIFCGEITI